MCYEEFGEDYGWKSVGTLQKGKDRKNIYIYIYTVVGTVPLIRKQLISEANFFVSS